MSKIQRNIAEYIALLKSFPPYKKRKRRNPYLRIKHLGNRKIFFYFYIAKILSLKYNYNDKIRKLKGVHLLPKIFSTIKPTFENSRYIFIYHNWKVIIKEEKKELHLLSLYNTDD